MTTRSRSFGVLLVAVLALGCSAGGGGTAPASNEESTVKGQVLILGKKAKAGTIIFHPQGREPIEGKVQPDGSYSLKTWAGTNMVSVRGADLERAAANKPPLVPYDVQPGEDVIDLNY